MNSNNTQSSILIIGAGLCGSLLALRMAQRGYQVQLIEKRPDLREVHQDAGRSINLAITGFNGKEVFIGDRKFPMGGVYKDEVFQVLDVN